MDVEDGSALAKTEINSRCMSLGTDVMHAQFFQQLMDKEIGHVLK